MNRVRAGSKFNISETCPDPLLRVDVLIMKTATEIVFRALLMTQL